MESGISAIAPEAIDCSYESLLEHGDATRDIGVSLQKSNGRRRSLSWHGKDTDEPTMSSIARPGGFRRHHVLQGPESAQNDQSSPSAEKDVAGVPNAAARRYAMRTSFMQQLLLVQRAYADAWEFSVSERTGDDGSFGLDRAAMPSPSADGRESDRQRPRGITEPLHLALMIAKCFISTVVLFLPRCLANGGLALALLSLVVVSLISIYGMRITVDCAARFSELQGIAHAPSYGDLGEAALGRLGRSFIEASVVLSQLCFCATTSVFVAVNLTQVVEMASECDLVPSVESVLTSLAPVMVLLALVRRMRYFAVTNLLATVFICAGLLLILGFSFWRLLSQQVIGPISWVNTEAYPLSLGTAAYTFEGIGMVMPMYTATDPSLQPRFKAVLTWTLLGVLAVEVLLATCVYACFTEDTQMIVLLNLPNGSLIKGLVLLLVSTAQLLTFPLLMFPVTSLLEACIFKHSGKTHSVTKHLKNVFRMSMVITTCVLAAYCAQALDNFVALVGALCCSPLSIIYPCIIHSRLIGGRHALNAVLSVVGTCLLVFCTFTAITSWGTIAQQPQMACASLNTE